MKRRHTFAIAHKLTSQTRDMWLLTSDRDACYPDRQPSVCASVRVFHLVLVHFIIILSI